MSSSPALAPLSPVRSPSLSSTFPRSPGEAPSTPAASSTCPPHAPPTPPDSSSRSASNVASSPRFKPSPSASSVLSISSTLSAAAPQFQSRLLDTPIDIQDLSSELDSPPTSRAPAVTAVDLDNAQATYKLREQGSPTPTQDVSSRNGQVESLPPPFVPVTARRKVEEEQANVAPAASQSSTSHPPNVYINGLPPNFPEEDLLAMTRVYGNVISVRTFTRHVSDKPSGYGFVLFEELSSAEKCIESLRKYRNLHPSFSKQVHKIPGTAYASAPSACATGPADSFKAKMEQLRDEASTNLYMEGLPLDIDEIALRAMVSPYRIMSFRFFTTRLSDPPRIIAFVRLESRTAAEDIIERLHGRLVRGKGEAGSRISVRFADTAEQRELRRAERHGREDEQSPARLTMARAALLNLKGTQYQRDPRSPSLASPDLSLLQTSPNLGLALNNLGLAQLGGALSPPSGPSPLQPQGPFSGAVGRHKLSQLSPSTTTLDSLNAQASHAPASDLRLPQQMPPSNANGILGDPSQLQLALMSMQGLRANSAQHGYTPVEQLILQAHARQRANTVATGVGNGSSHLQDSAGARLSGANAGRDVNRRLLDCLPQMSEDDFHAAANLLQDRVAQAFSPEVDGGAFGLHREALSASLDRDLDRQLQLGEQKTRQRNHTLATQVRGDGSVQGLHARSSTLPSQYLGARNSVTQTFPHSGNTVYDTSLNIGNGISIHTQQPRTSNTHIPRTTNTGYKHVSSSTNSNAQQLTGTHNLSTNPQTNTHTLFTSKSNINLPSSGARAVRNPTSAVQGNAAPPSVSTTGVCRARKNGTNVGVGTVSSGGNLSQVQEGPADTQDADADDESSVVSPALTYSTRTPATLSPATPYSGFFGDGGDGFKGSAVRVGAVTEGAPDLLPPSKNAVGVKTEVTAPSALNQ
ncbi:hypothetical protein C8Q77DRAFT_1156630 [Trametes polyzona]|nr:hypothetical protein C8Q77DRAFT_1156630 [Trametes polyzona]